jgi:UDP-glucose 4-epimerase
MKKEYILVTGAAGFIGSAVANKLIELGNSVITIDNLSTGEKCNLNKNLIFFQGDVFDTNILDQVFNYNIKAIIHIAGQSSGEISYDNPIYDLRSNTESTLLLLKYAKNNNCNKFIFASTMSVYGEQETELVDEKSIPNPISFYSVGKLASESYMKIYSKLGINCIALRLFNVYGPGQNLKNLRQGMVSIFLAQAFKNKYILIKGSGERFRDMIYIDDVVEAFIKCLNYNTEFKIYNVSTGKKTKVSEVINSIKIMFSDTLTIHYDGETPGDIFGIYGDNNLIKSDLNWSPKMNFKDGLTNMYNWIIRNKIYDL